MHLSVVHSIRDHVAYSTHLLEGSQVLGAALFDLSWAYSMRSRHNLVTNKDTQQWKRRDAFMQEKANRKTPRGEWEAKSSVVLHPVTCVHTSTHHMNMHINYTCGIDIHNVMQSTHMPAFPWRTWVTEFSCSSHHKYQSVEDCRYSCSFWCWMLAHTLFPFLT